MDNISVQEYLTQGAVLSGQRKYREAIAYYQKAEKESPMNIDVYISKGIAYANLDELDNAKAQFEKALKINKTSGLAYYHLGSVAILQGDISSGFENYNKAIANGFDDAQLYYSLGLLHEENGDADLAIRNYNKAIAKDAMRPDIRIRKARLFLDGGHFPEALQALDETILTNPDVFEGYHLKFVVLMQLKQYEKAENVLEEAMKLFPKDPAFIIDKVTLLIEQNKEDEALETLAALEKDEDTDDSVLRRIYMERAQIYVSRNNAVSAISELEKAKELSEKTGDFDSEVNFLLANCHLSTEEYEKVLKYSRELLNKSEDSYYKETARYFEPFSLKMLGKNEEALPKYKDAIEEYRNQSLAIPGNLDSYLLRIMCLRDIEQYEKALELIDYVKELQPESVETRLLRVTVLEAMGNKEEAIEEAKEANVMLPQELRKK